MYSSTNLFPATSSPPNPVSRAAHWFQTSTRPSRSIPKIGAFALRGFFSCLCLRVSLSRDLCPCLSDHPLRAPSVYVSLHVLVHCSRHRRDHVTLKSSENAKTRVSINRKLSLSWMFRAKRRRPVGGDVAPLTDRRRATPSFTSEGNSSVAPASQHLRATSASARDSGDDDTSPSSSQAARNRFMASSEAWLWPAHLYSPEAFASTVLLRASSAARDTCEVPSPSSSKALARRLARVVRARFLGCGEAIGPEGLSSTRRA